MPDQYRGLPEVLDVVPGEDSCTLSLRVPDQCKWFDGHFDGAPILSGVAQMDWIMSLAEEYLGLNQGFAGIDALKFQQAIQPGDLIRLELVWARDKQLLRFEISAESKITSGRMLLGQGAE